jgi:single-strand DNA-binding protein
MNNLNSVLIEGTLMEDALYATKLKGEQVCTFAIVSNHYDKNGDEHEKTESHITIEVRAKLARTCYEEGHKGRGVRVVGRLKEESWYDAGGKVRSKVWIVAEHVEFRPEPRKKGKG